jgi:hypothetical protein
LAGALDRRKPHDVEGVVEVDLVIDAENICPPKEPP